MNEEEAKIIAALVFYAADTEADNPAGALSIFCALFPEHKVIAAQLYDREWGNGDQKFNDLVSTIDSHSIEMAVKEIRDMVKEIG